MSTTSKRQVGLLVLAAAALVGLIAAAVFTVMRGEAEDRSFGPPSSWNAAQREHVALQRQAIEQAMNVREFEQARRIAAEHLERFPRDPQGRSMLAQVLYAQGREDEALVEARQSLEQNADQEKVLWFAASLAVRKGFHDEAIGYYRQAESLNPVAPQYPLALSNVYLKINRPVEVQKHALRALQLSPNLHQAYALMAEASAKQGHVNAALDHIEKAIYLCKPEQPHYRTYVLRKAALQRRANQPGVALDTLRMLDDSLQTTAEVAKEMAAAYLMLSQPEQAAEVWKRVYDRRPSAVAAAEVGLCLHRAADLSAAQHWLKTAEMLMADHPRVEALRVTIEQTTP